MFLFIAFQVESYTSFSQSQMHVQAVGDLVDNASGGTEDESLQIASTALLALGGAAVVGVAGLEMFDQMSSHGTSPKKKSGTDLKLQSAKTTSLKKVSVASSVRVGASEAKAMSTNKSSLVQGPASVARGAPPKAMSTSRGPGIPRAVRKPVVNAAVSKMPIHSPR